VELPAGEVTFLFTDIEGSTRLFQALGDRYPELLAEHNRIIRDAIAGRGVEVSTEGDAFFIAFADARDALAAAVAAQTGLGAHAWPDDGVIKVRMGLHTGQAEPVGNNYIALAVHQAARVANAGHGGQIVVSSATAARCDRASLHPLGPYLLKDFPAVEVLYQAGTGAFPPLRTPTAATNLPRPRTQLFGRDDELQSLDGLLAAHQVVTLTGTGGTGKTRLAIELARRTLPRFGNGAVWVDLASRTDPALVPRALADALGVTEQLGRVLVHTLVDHLCQTETLIVIDNCEHVIDAAAHLVEHLINTCERVKIVATSREPLGVIGEAVFRVPSLRDANAVGLFVDRVQQVNPTFNLDDATRPAVEQICARLDGIPLAIELAASRAKGLTVFDIAARIEDRFALLTGGARTALPRQQTLRGLVDWSYDLLDEDEREVFQHLSVFYGRFPLEAAAFVAGELGVDVISVIGRLVDKSLVNASTDGDTARFSLLQTIRHYGFDRLLDAGRAAEARTRHRDWCVEAARRYPEWPASTSRLFAEQHGSVSEMIDDVRNALDWSTTRHEFAPVVSILRHLFGYFRGAGLLTEYRERSDALLATGALTELEHAAVLANAAAAAWEQGDNLATVEYGTPLLELDPELVAEAGWAESVAINLVAVANWQLGNWDVAERQLRDALRVAGDDAAPTIVQNIGLLQHAWGDHEAAKRSFREAIRLALATDDGWFAQVCFVRIAAIALAEDNLDEAARILDEAQATPGRTHAMVLMNLGELALKQRRFDDAIAAFTGCANRFRREGIPEMAARQDLNVARVLSARGDHAAAQETAARALSVLEELGHGREISIALVAIARLAEAGDTPAAACARWQEAVAALRPLHERHRTGNALIELARAAKTAGDLALAHAAQDEAREMWEPLSGYPAGREALKAIDALEI
jgi:predicted ATPase/class 3 adenylate cyclase